MGRYAMGGAAMGSHVISDSRRDLSEEAFFQALLGFDLSWLHSLS